MLRECGKPAVGVCRICPPRRRGDRLRRGRDRANGPPLSHFRHVRQVRRLCLERPLAEGLKKFRGIRRRFEPIGKWKGAELIADYAHHPREIAAALQTAREICGGRLFVVFQPHTYSRTKLLFEDFVSVLSGVENLVIYKTYPAREYFDAAGSALTLSEHLPNALYIESVRELEIYLRCSLGAGDVILFLGAGDIYFAAKQIVLNLKNLNS